MPMMHDVSGGRLRRGAPTVVASSRLPVAGLKRPRASPHALHVAAVRRPRPPDCRCGPVAAPATYGAGAAHAARAAWTYAASLDWWQRRHAHQRPPRHAGGARRPHAVLQLGDGGRPDESRLALIRSDAIEVVDLAPRHSSRRIPPHGVKPVEWARAPTWVWRSHPTAGAVVGSANEGQIMEARPGVRDGDRDDRHRRRRLRGQLRRRLRPRRATGGRSTCVDQFNYRLVTVDVASGTVRAVRARRSQSVRDVPLARRAAGVGLQRRHVRVPAAARRDRRRTGRRPACRSRRTASRRRRPRRGRRPKALSARARAARITPTRCRSFEVDLATGPVEREDQDRLPRRRRARRHRHRRRRESRRVVVGRAFASTSPTPPTTPSR